ncbi:restriction endonuclease subunit S [Pseudoalteromonas sp. APC 3355]|jgi:type I restriction enzyme S subunit|uniref:restriction endonuclease subunit S n=1 Tax=Pseudoalteromonas sp. APC 3355 TaxID=3035199 RepID=UPI0025B438D1|nr:restriction endonuclease subunit S [Pseudoalteromonas sp. APC 3355]MDN3474466.1 restriction endonuclease subunit S [Pseudoalteromonas sp. APC 3355]
MVPSGWKRKPLVNVAEIRTGVAKGKKGLKDPIEVPYLRVANVQDGHIDLTEVKTIAIERHQLERYSLKSGDVLMTEGGDFDKLGRGDVWQGQIQPCLNQNHVFAVRVDSKYLEPYYLAALSGSHYGKTYFLSCAKRSTNLASINSTQLKEFPVLIPPLVEQRKISKILSTWDKAIRTTERLIDNGKQQKKALMQQLLTRAHTQRKRLLDDSGKAFEGEWEEVKLGDIVSTGRGFAFKSTQYSESGYKIVRVTNIDSSGKIDLSDCVYIPAETAYEYKKYELIENDILLVMVGATAGKLGFVSDNTLPALLNQNMWSLRSKDSKRLCQIFLRHVIYQVVAKYLLSQQGSARGFFTQKTFESVKFSIPTIKEQQKVASVLTNADKEIELLEQQLADLKQEKKALMQQLLTGKRRVKIND